MFFNAMEKRDFATQRPARTTRYSTIRLASIAVVLALCLFSYGRLPSFVAERHDHGIAESRTFHWSQIKPSRQLKYHDCFDDFQCARLDVPLDWRANQTGNGYRAAIAIIKIPAAVPVTDPRYGGAILINPGGPGGSGVGAAMRFGQEVQTIASSSLPPTPELNAKYYDVIGFDPRGVNNTTPSASCFPDAVSRQNYYIEAQAQGLSTSNESFTTVYQRVKALSSGCSARLSGEEVHGVGRYMSTPSVVNDMIEIAERLGEWRDKEARKQLTSIAVPKGKIADIVERTRWQKGHERVMYWGFSYGTLLGATLATMYPGRMHRVVLDGVVDADDYYAGTWLSNLQDTDKIMEHFHTECHEAGPKHCALYSTEGPQASKKVVAEVLSTLKASPLPVPAHGKYGPDLITYSDLMSQIRDTLYKPAARFKDLARTISALSAGNGTSLAVLKQDGRRAPCPSSQCEKQGPWSKACGNPTDQNMLHELSAAIHCTDAPDQTSWTAADHWRKWQVLRNQSAWLGDDWASITMYCNHWHARPAWEFNTTLAADTAHPVLWLASSRDPVTPLRNAVKMAGRFNGSVVLRQDAEGHCSSSAPSMCTAKLVRRYFQTGELPDADVICKPDKNPFMGEEDFAKLSEAFTEVEDRRLFDALLKLSEAQRGQSMMLGV